MLYPAELWSQYCKKTDSEKGGFEPPDPLPGQLLNREPDSTALAPLQSNKKTDNNQTNRVKSGERGIRTPGDLRPNSFQDCLLRPLGHLSLITAMAKARQFSGCLATNRFFTILSGSTFVKSLWESIYLS